MIPTRQRWMLVAVVLTAAVMMISCNLFKSVQSLTRQQAGGTPAASETVTQANVLQYLTTRELREESRAPEYTVGMVYPYIESGVKNGFNTAVKTLMDEVYKEFKTSLENEPIIEDDPLAVNLNALTMDYRLYYSSADLISIYFTFSEYHAGAAHPNAYSAVINYSLAHDRVIELDEIFIPNSNYLQVISEYCVNHLKNDESFMFEDGAKPLAENFRNWNIVPEGILVTFDPYQIAPYAAGFIKVIVPFSVLRTYLAEGGLLTLPAE